MTPSLIPPPSTFYLPQKLWAPGGEGPHLYYLPSHPRASSVELVHYRRHFLTYCMMYKWIRLISLLGRINTSLFKSVPSLASVLQLPRWGGVGGRWRMILSPQPLDSRILGFSGNSQDALCKEPVEGETKFIENSVLRWDDFTWIWVAQTVEPISWTS